jgi:hypothetical protein
MSKRKIPLKRPSEIFQVLFSSSLYYFACGLINCELALFVLEADYKNTSQSSLSPLCQHYNMS